MSRLNELWSQITTQIEAYAQRVQDSDTYQQLADRYNSLSPQGQKLTNFVVVFFILFLALFFPGTNYLDSQTQVTTFEEQRGLLKDLFKTYREASSQSGLPVPPSSEMMVNQINSQLRGAQLLPEQILSVSPGQIEGSLIPQSLVRDVVVVSLTKLNLRQVLDIGNNLNRISQTVKVKDLNIQASANMPGYFDTTFKLYALNIPEPIELAPPEPEAAGNDNRDRGGSGSTRGNSNRNNEDQ